MLARLIKEYLLLKFSFIANSAVITIDSLYFTPSVLNYLGILLFFFGAAFSLLVLYIIKEEVLHKRNILNILVYLIVYLSVYPIVMITAIFKLLKKDLSW